MDEMTGDSWKTDTKFMWSVNYYEEGCLFCVKLCAGLHDWVIY